MHRIFGILYVGTMKHWYICVVQSCTFPHLRAAYLVSVFFFVRSFPAKNRPNRPNQDLRETFKALDANGDGFLTVTELRDGIDKAGMETGGHGCGGWRWVIMLKPVSPKKIPKYKRGMVLWNKIGVNWNSWFMTVMYKMSRCQTEVQVVWCKILF